MLWIALIALIAVGLAAIGGWRMLLTGVLLVCFAASIYWVLAMAAIVFTESSRPDEIIITPTRVFQWVILGWPPPLSCVTILYLVVREPLAAYFSNKKFPTNIASMPEE